MLNLPPQQAPLALHPLPLTPWCLASFCLLAAHSTCELVATPAPVPFFDGPLRDRFL